MSKRILSLTLTILLLLSLLPTALAVPPLEQDLNGPDVFLKQTSSNGTCTLVATAMMLRRAAILEGDPNWSQITVDSCRAAFWRPGLPYQFTYGHLTMGHDWLPGGEANRQILIDLLAAHPEGIVLHSVRAAHGVLLTDYTDGVFYCADSSHGVPEGRIPIDQAHGTRIENSNAYWYVTTPLLLAEPEPEPAPELELDPVPAEVIFSVSEHLGLEAPCFMLSSGITA